jgi:glycosyltransferase involved in cell wall biosynthesis
VKITALIPAFNEEDRIAATVAAVRGIEAVTDILVIDDASKDDTAQRANDAGAHVIRLSRNVGKGKALEIAAKQSEDAEVVLLLDADLAGSATQAQLLLEPVLAGMADMSIAAFPKPVGKAGFGLVKGLAVRAIKRASKGAWQASAPLSGQRALTRDCLDAVRPFAYGYGVEVTMTVRALRKGYRLLEVPTTMSHAATGRDISGFIHRGKQFKEVFWAIVKLRFEK